MKTNRENPGGIETAKQNAMRRKTQTPAYNAGYYETLDPGIHNTGSVHHTESILPG